MGGATAGGATAGGATAGGATAGGADRTGATGAGVTGIAAAAAAATGAAAGLAAATGVRARRPRFHQRSRGMDIISSASMAASVVTASRDSGVLAMDSQTIPPANSAAHRYMISTLERCE
jgi:hypothetical protein